MEAQVILVETYIGLSTARSIVDMKGNHIVALDERRPCSSGQMHFHVLMPFLLRRNYLYTVHIGLALVVVRIDYPEVTLQVFCRQGNMPADIAVGIIAAPGCLDVGIFVLGAPGTCLRTPTALVEIQVHPCVSHRRGQAGADLSLISALISHRSDGQEFGRTLGTHEAIDLAIHAQQAIHCLLLVVPVLCCTIRQFVVGRPEREIGVIQQQWNAGQTKSRLFVGSEVILILSLNNRGCC